MEHCNRKVAQLEKKSGVDEVTRPLPHGGGAVHPIGETFQPNLAMGGGSFRVPLDLPSGPGGISPKVELLYNTGFGNGAFGLGWDLAIPFIEQRKGSAGMASTEPKYNVSGAESLLHIGDNQYTPAVQPAYQVFTFDGAQWTSETPNLIKMQFGSSDNSRIFGEVDSIPFIARWLLDRILFPNGLEVHFDYGVDGTQRYLQRISWSVFKLELEYELRPDPFSNFAFGFELRTNQRCRRISLHHDRLAPTLTRSYDLKYEQAPVVGTSLLNLILVTGWRWEEGQAIESQMPPLRFSYTSFNPGKAGIRKFTSRSIPPPPLEEDVTILDYHGTGLPGVLRLDGLGGTFWENLGDLGWGPPEPIRHLPQGVHLGEDRVRFADLSGNLAADLIVDDMPGAGYFPLDPFKGFARKEIFRLQPSFGLTEPGSHFLDLDGEGSIDFLTFRNGNPIAFFNENGRGWSKPVILPRGELPDIQRHDIRRVRFADMNGDGTPDLVLIQSRRIVYWPNLGYGRFGTMRVMQNSPEFLVARPDEDVYLADLDADGTADLIMVGKNRISISLNSSGEYFGPVFELTRTPALSATQFLLADLTGSSTPGFVWTSEGDSLNSHNAWFLDLLQGVKPYLLQTIDNGMGLTIAIDYTTSTFERVADFKEGRQWLGYLPFAVHVVSRIVVSDSVTGLHDDTKYRYHDGHYDIRNRSFLGFAEVQVRKLGTMHEDESLQRYFFHNGVEEAGPKFEAGRGQPRRIELIDTRTGEIRRVEEAIWDARKLLPVANEKEIPYLALLMRRESRRYDSGVLYEAEQIDNEYDAIGNSIRETRSCQWTDGQGASHDEKLVVETSYAVHQTSGLLTNFPSQIAKHDGKDRLLKHMTFYYDGPSFIGLPFGFVDRGWKSRQTEVAMTTRDIAEAYGPVPPMDLGDFYRVESIPGYGMCYLKDTRRYRFDSFGNQVETIDALGHRVELTYDDDSIWPISYRGDGGSARAMLFDPIAEQIRLVEDMNGNKTETMYDGLGNARLVFHHGAQADLPTESYEYLRDSIPNVIIKRQRMRPDDIEPGWVEYKYLDGSGRPCQVKTLAENGKWAVDRQKIETPTRRALWECDAYLAEEPSYDPLPPTGTLLRRFHYDYAGRLSEESFYNGGVAKYFYVGNEARFYGPAATAALETNIATPPSRISRTDAWGRIVGIIEPDEEGEHEQRREHDALGRLSRIIHPQGFVALSYLYDLWGNTIRIDSAEAGITKRIFNAGNNEVLRIDADGRMLTMTYDIRGRIIHVSGSGPTGGFEERYSYDVGAGDNLQGRLARVEGDFGSVEYSYSTEGDPVNIRRTFATQPKVYELHFAYDNQRKITSVTYPDGTKVDYQRANTGLLKAIPGFIDDIDYDATGFRTKIAYANGVVTTRQYSAGDHLLLEIITTRHSNQHKYQHLTYVVDEVGQVIQVKDESTVLGKIRNNQTFEYDSHNKLVHATGRGPSGEYAYGYAYDIMGNLVLSEESFAEQMDFGYHMDDKEHPNRLIKRHPALGPEYTYDASGNLTRDLENSNFTYDARHQLIRVDRKDGNSIEYRYDHRGIRTETRITSEGTTFVRYNVEGLYYVEGNRATKVVFDGDQQVALVPDDGIPLVYHHDRLGNVNVVSHLVSGAFIGYNEYTPFGQLVVSQILPPFHGFQGSYTDGIAAELLLLGARYYSPRLGRFLTPDAYLMTQPDRIPPLLAAANLYLYGMDNPVNFVDPTGQIAFIAVILIAAVVGAILGAGGAIASGVQSADEFLLWIIGGAIGAVAAVLLGAAGAAIAGIILGLKGAAAAAAISAAAISALITWSVLSVLSRALTPFLDKSDSEAAWVFSFALKWLHSPLTSLVGTAAAVVVAAMGNDVDLRRGVLFIETGNGRPGTIGAFVWTPSGRFDANGRVRDDLAQHEAHHSRTVASLGEFGFYFTYFTIGLLWGAAEGDGFSKDVILGVNTSGCGNPFEKTAYTYDKPNTGVC